MILDSSKYFNRRARDRPAARRARVQPGCVLDDLNRALKPHGLLFAPDISTSNRATIGGMIANNSSGARSVIYGKTIDHVLALKVVLADGRVVECRAARRTALERQVHAGRISKGNAIARCAGSPRSTPTRSSGGIPKILRRVGGYNLDAFVPGPGPAAFNLAHLFVGSEGTLGVTVEATLRLVALPKARATFVIEFAELLDALAATPAILRPSAVGRRGRRPLRAREHQAEPRGDPPSRVPPAAIPARSCSSSSTMRPPSALPPRLDALEADLRAGASATTCSARTDPAAQARIWKLRTLALGLSMAEKGDAKALSFVEDTAVAPEHLRDYIAEFLERSSAAIRRRRASMLMRQLAACTSGRSSISRPRRGCGRSRRSPADVAGSFSSTAERTLGRARRRPRPQPVPGDDVRTGPLRGVPHAQANVRPE